MKLKSEALKNVVLSALFLALGIMLPFFTGQIKEIGDTLLPMHFPVMLCGLICGYRYGFAIGLMLPFLRSFLFLMPPLYPNAVWMAAELAAYGLATGLCYFVFFKRRVYISLAVSMIVGRIVWGVTKGLLLGFKSFGIGAFISGGFLDAVPGILLQFILIPLIIKIFERAK